MSPKRARFLRRLRPGALTPLLGCALLLAAPHARADGPAPPALPFSENLGAALAEAAEQNKPVVVAFVAGWCPVCRRMEREAFRDPEVLALEDRFLWVMVEIDRNLRTAREYQVEGLPTIQLVDSGGRIRERFLGYQSPAEFRTNLSLFLEHLETSRRPGPKTFTALTRPSSELIWTPTGYRGAGICFSHVGYGPLNVYSQSPFQALRLGIRPRTPSTLGRGQYEVRQVATWVNLWANSLDEFDNDTYLLDFEMLQLATSAAYGLTDHLQIEGEFQIRRRFGGDMDRFIQGFHDLLDLDQAGRKDFPRGAFQVSLRPPGRPSIELEPSERGTFTRSLQFTVQHNVTCGKRAKPALSYSFTGRLETIDTGDLRGGDDFDFGASVALSRRFGPFYVYGTLGYAWFGASEFRGLDLDDSQFTALAALEWRLGARMSLLVQYLLTEGLLDDFPPFSDLSNEVTFGWKWEVLQKTTLEVGLIENVATFDNSPDFGFHVGFARRF